MNYSFCQETIVDEAVASLVAVGFEKDKALILLKANAAQLRLVLSNLSEQDALNREAVATVVRFATNVNASTQVMG